MRGRKPKPTRLKVITGNPGKRPINTREPQIKAPLLHAPDWLDEEQMEQWRFAIHHAPDGVLGTIDRELLAAWCVACVMFKRATEMQRQIDRNGTLPMLTRTPNGMAVQSPYISIANRQQENMRKIAAELGFTPSSRSRIATGGAGAPEDDEYAGII